MSDIWDRVQSTSKFSCVMKVEHDLHKKDQYINVTYKKYCLSLTCLYYSFVIFLLSSFILGLHIATTGLVP